MRRGAEAIFCSIPARIGILGNPSDGYNGQCISSLARNWRASGVLTPHENRWDFSIDISCGDEKLEYKSLASLAENPPDLSQDRPVGLGYFDSLPTRVCASGLAIEASGFN